MLRSCMCVRGQKLGSHKLRVIGASHANLTSLSNRNDTTSGMYELYLLMGLACVANASVVCSNHYNEKMINMKLISFIFIPFR